MSVMCCCIFCKEEKSVKGIHTHVDRSHLGATKYSSGFNGKYAAISAKLSKKAEYLQNPKTCSNCGVEIPYSKRKNTFCSSSCSAKVTNALKDYSLFKTGPAKAEKVLIKKVCLGCSNNFTTTYQKKTFCSGGCATKYRAALLRPQRTDWQNYRKDCQFKFNLSEFPNKFDFELLRERGWYHPVKNPNGVSRDHKVSCKEGFVRNLPAEHLRHPANCKLMIHTENISKNVKSSITYEELLDAIRVWDASI